MKEAPVDHLDELVDSFDIDPSAYIAPQTFLAGRITIGPESSIWPMTVIRAEECSVTIGAFTNIQDGSIIHGDYGFDVLIGDRVTVGHGAIIHGAVIEDEALIGIGAVILNGARVGRGSLVAARALITEGMQVPPSSLVMGIPGKVRPLSEEQAARVAAGATHYAQLKELYKRRA
jgi:carbonic anhydrase/acetyltransferase-like protein (isoleucine patch superfamily)